MERRKQKREERKWEPHIQHQQTKEEDERRAQGEVVPLPKSNPMASSANPSWDLSPIKANDPSDNESDIGEPPTLTLPLKATDWLLPPSHPLPGRKPGKSWIERKLGKGPQGIRETAFLVRASAARLASRSPGKSTVDSSSKKANSVATTAFKDKDKTTRPSVLVSQIKSSVSSVLGKHRREEKGDQEHHQEENAESETKLKEESVTKKAKFRETMRAMRALRSGHISPLQDVTTRPASTSPHASSRDMVSQVTRPASASPHGRQKDVTFRASRPTSTSPIAHSVIFGSGDKAKEKPVDAKTVGVGKASQPVPPLRPGAVGTQKRKRETAASAESSGTTAVKSKSSFWDRISRNKDRKGLVPARRVPRKAGDCDPIEEIGGLLSRPAKRRAVSVSTATSSAPTTASSTPTTTSSASTVVSTPPTVAKSVPRPARRTPSSLLRPTASSAAKASTRASSSAVASSTARASSFGKARRIPRSS
ncbi:hypothetical protein BJ684DRAFT_16767 [Piptocephalis cylindrospora]|uniref:Uncharacterized protein n=1 Tax=Piptocephalis cylindrospora TaxID=1907219 RepID=A0A4P9Y276_9FUNG|nr:hypothetical protein BJ684DRAFT_16767 [Piptocephalis cylindrospora]|eukprot:RKP12784.1 hypothetical protein BJ684DRAFT_16767 [Piptocephalis cylindrospora]